MRYTLLILVFGILSCSRQNNKENNTQQADETVLNFAQGVSQNLGNDLWIRNMILDSSNISQSCLGISVHGLIEASQESVDLLKKNGYDAFFFAWSVKNQNKELYTNASEYQNKIGKEFLTNVLPFVSQAGRYNFNHHIPFSDLGLAQGSHNIEVCIDVFPARFSAENPEKYYKKLQYMGDSELSKFSINQQINSPQLYKGYIEIKQFEIDQTDNRKYDITLNGTGLPDPFWELESGNRILFSSKPIKNTYYYKVSSKTPDFLVSQKDTMKIIFYDFDYGPFNAKDLISEWKGTYEDLQKSKPTSVGSIQKLSLQSHFKKI
jgi:hypothetical protein